MHDDLPIDGMDETEFLQRRPHLGNVLEGAGLCPIFDIETRPDTRRAICRELRKCD